MEQDHENQRTEMNRLFENQKNAMIDDYERRLKELEERKTQEFNDMQAKLLK
mgnify:CR=1 FL=1